MKKKLKKNTQPTCLSNVIRWLDGNYEEFKQSPVVQSIERRLNELNKAIIIIDRELAGMEINMTNQVKEDILKMVEDLFTYSKDPWYFDEYRRTMETLMQTLNDNAPRCNFEFEPSLEDCAFCGGEPKLTVLSDNSSLGFIRCTNCGMQTPIAEKNKIIKIWNERKGILND